MKLKLCGIRRAEDVEMINRAAPDYAGFVFWRPSKRYVSPETARALGESLAHGIKSVGVFVNESPDTVARTAEAARLHAVQLHGDEDDAYIASLRRAFGGEIWKAFGIRRADDVRRAEQSGADMLLFDAFAPTERGGTGRRLELRHIIEAAPSRRYFLAGGINAANLNEILNTLRPYGLDISSGFELDGVKNKERLDGLMKIVDKERMKEK